MHRDEAIYARADARGVTLTAEEAALAAEAVRTSSRSSSMTQKCVGCGRFLAWEAEKVAVPVPNFLHQYIEDWDYYHPECAPETASHVRCGQQEATHERRRRS